MLSSETRAEIERRALQITAVIETRDGKFDAEIIANCRPLWHLLNVRPGSEDKTSEFLVERGFGVFIPRFQKGAKLRIPIEPKKRVDRLSYEEIDLSEKLIFPGRILLFCWDVLAHWRRIKSCPGVHSVLCNDSECPIVVMDGQIAKIQAMQFTLVPCAKPRDRHKSRRRNRDEGGDMLTITTKSYWVADEQARTSLLDKAMRVAS